MSDVKGRTIKQSNKIKLILGLHCPVVFNLTDFY